MYTLSVPYVDYNKKPRTESVSFNLDAREVFKMLPELQAVFSWLEANQRAAEERTLEVEEVRDFYNNLEYIILEAYGELSQDGKHFRKAGKYEFEESALFNACMVLFVTKPEEATKLLDGILPKELFEMVKNADANDLAKATDTRVTEQQAEIERLRAELAASKKQS